MAQAVEANLFAFFQHLARWPRVELHDEPDCCWTLSDLPFPLFNSVLRARLPDDRVDALIDARIAACGARNVPMLWWTGPSTTPADLGERLDRTGFVLEAARRDGGRPGVDAGPAATIADATIAIEPVEDAATLAKWSRVLCDAFGAPQPFGEAFAELAVDDRPRCRDRRSAIFSRASTASRRRRARCFSAPASPASTTCRRCPERRKRGLGRLVTRRGDARGARARLSHGDPALVGCSAPASIARSASRMSAPIGQHVWAPEDFRR